MGDGGGGCDKTAKCTKCDYRVSIALVFLRVSFWVNVQS